MGFKGTRTKRMNLFRDGGQRMQKEISIQGWEASMVFRGWGMSSNQYRI